MVVTTIIISVFIVYYISQWTGHSVPVVTENDESDISPLPFVPTFIPNPIIPDEDEIYEQVEDDFEEVELTIDDSLKLDSDLFLFTQYPPPASLTPTDTLTASRQKQIIEAFRHAWKGYSKDAYGKDEYQPLSHSGHDWAPGGLGLMIIDSLDTMLLMNLTTEYNQARHWVATKLNFNKDQGVNVFETTIRILGGLLSAYHLSNNDKLYLEKAVDLGDRLLYAFDTDSGIPYSDITLSTGIPNSYGPSSTAEAATIQLEFKYLSHLTGDMKYWNAAEKVMERLNELVTAVDAGAVDGLVPIYIE